MKKNLLPIFMLFAFGSGANAQDVSIYTNNGTLTGNRTLTLGTYSLAFKPSALANGLFLSPNGSVGINTTIPTEKLDVNGNIKALRGLFTTSPANGQTFATNNDRVIASTVMAAGAVVNPETGSRVFTFMDMPQSNFNTASTSWFNIDNRNHWTRLRFVAIQDGASDFSLFDKTQNENFLVADGGNDNIVLRMPKPNSLVMIGTSSYTDGTDIYRLSVNGNVRAHRVKVYTTWADFVFEDGYNLPSLEDVEKHIKEKGHLQDIPSAKEVEKKGIELGEMNKLLLQKIEELTLYMIEHKKENEKQSLLIKELEQKVENLQAGNKQ